MCAAVPRLFIVQLHGRSEATATAALQDLHSQMERQAEAVTACKASAEHIIQELVSGGGPDKRGASDERAAHVVC